MTASREPPRALVDTNILVYAHDENGGDKRHRAKELIAGLQAVDGAIVSVQVLNEFYVSVTRARPSPLLTHEFAVAAVRDVLRAWTVVPLTARETLRALSIIPRHSLSFWDALLWATAKENGVTTIYTEDFQHGRVIEGVRFVNPFVVQPETESESQR